MNFDRALCLPVTGLPRRNLTSCREVQPLLLLRSLTVVVCAPGIIRTEVRLAGDEKGQRVLKRLLSLLAPYYLRVSYRKYPRRWTSAKRQKSRSLRHLGHCVSTAKVRTSLAESDGGRPAFLGVGGCGSVHHSSTRT
jgi:hypothetical protein